MCVRATGAEIGAFLDLEPAEEDMEAALATAQRLIARQAELDRDIGFLAEELEKRRRRRGSSIDIPTSKRVSYTEEL